MTRRLSLAHLTAITLPPPQFIEAAAQAGFDGVGLRLLRVTPDSPGYPLMDDPALMRATRATLTATGLIVSDIEFVKITPDLDPVTLLPMIAAGAELGARHLICAPYDPDLSRLSDTLAEIARLCAEHGLGAVLEFFPWTPVPDLHTCWQVVRDTGAGLLVDALHFDRSRSDLALLRDIPPARLPFAHLCDATRAPSYDTDTLLRTARTDRLMPGQGQIDLVAFLRALPAELPLGLEVPMAIGTPDIQTLRLLHSATLRVLAQV
jgi:sugar phosphate isomerase/epimerase